MDVFSIQKVHCQICGGEFETDFGHRGGYGANRECCSPFCFEELQWRRALATMGKEYHPNPSPKTCWVCKGQRTVEGRFWHAADDTEITVYPCPHCSADEIRSRAKKDCPECSGKGFSAHYGPPIPNQAGGVCRCVKTWTGRKS